MQETREKLTLAADDFGISASANKNILALANRVKIDRVAVIVDGFFTEEETRTLLSSGVKLDIHLTLPKRNHRVSPGEAVLRRFFYFLAALALGKISPKKIAAEWERQTKKFKAIFGQYPDGINSHEYVHFFPPYLKIAVTLGKKFKIGYMRFGKKEAPKGKNLSAKIIKNLWHNNFSFFKKSGLISSDLLISLDWIKDIEKFLENLAEGEKTEIVCHPENAGDFAKIEKYF